MRNLLMIGALVVLTPSSPGAQGAAPPDAPYTAVVSPSEARFVFPVTDRSEWEWCRTTTDENSLEYQWAVTVESRGQPHEFGYFLFKAPGRTTGRGDLPALVRAGQLSVFAADRPPETGSTLVRTARVRAVPAPHQLVIVVDDAATLRLLFSERPESATFATRLPDEESVTRTVRIAYSR